MVPLDYRLKNSDSVEIIAGKTLQPSRDWLSPQSGYLASPRHRNKVKAWFRKQNETENKVAGRALFEREIQRLGMHGLPMPELLAELKLPNLDALHEALGIADVSAAQVAGAIQRLHARDQRLTGRGEAGTRGDSGTRSDDAARSRAPAEREPEVEVQGIGDLLSTYARCCRPVPPEAIAGYITVGRGVSIHAESCANLARLSAKTPARLLPVSWGALKDGEFPVDIEIEAFDRRGLVRDVSAVLTDDKISIQGMRTVTDKRDQVAHMQISISISGLPQLSRVLARIAQLENIISVKRRR
jgi:GTP pyrophosphokinase